MAEVEVAGRGIGLQIQKVIAGDVFRAGNGICDH